MQNFDNFFADEADKFFVRANNAIREEHFMDEDEEFKKVQDEQEFSDRYNSYSKETEEREKQKAQSALDLFEKGLTKTEIKAMASAAVESVLIKGDPLKVVEALCGMSTFIKEVEADDKLDSYVQEELKKHPKGKYVSPSGAKIECCEVGSKYDFSKCNDPELMELEKLFAETKALIDAKKEFLKTVPPKGIDIRFNDELVSVYAPSKSSTSSYKVTLAR